MGLKVRNRGPQLSHLLFADDSSVFMEATLANYTVLKEIRQRFGRASGESINFNKIRDCVLPPTPLERLRRIFLVEWGGYGWWSKVFWFTYQLGKIQEASFVFFVRDRILSKIQGWVMSCKHLGRQMGSYPVTAYASESYWSFSWCYFGQGFIPRFWQKNWNQELVRSSFPAEVCSSILAMPISWENVEDKLCICAGH